jgi:hypothetical protein
MSDLAKYMNDPDIIDEPMALREVHAIRLMINDETKDMTPEERAARTRKEAGEIMEKYGLAHLRVAGTKRD